MFVVECIGGGDRTRTCYLLLAKQPLYQVSYTPNNFFRFSDYSKNHRIVLKVMVGLVGLEPTTPALSRQCSNQLSYRPKLLTLEFSFGKSPSIRCGTYTKHTYRSQSLATTTSTTDKCGHSNLIAVSRKEVIQPHLPIRLPCYDFTPVTNPAVVIALLAVRLTTSGRTRSHGVTGGVYKTRERIHRDILIHDY
jgi:hypothetical protein